MNGGPVGAGQGPLRFGERMTGVESLMWRLGRHDARFRATMSLVVEMDGPLSRPALLARLSSLCHAVPRLRDRVRESPLAMVPPVWEADPSFSVERHVYELREPLWEAASSVVAAPFEEGRPPWRIAVASWSPATLVLHLHHSYTDGLGGMRLLAELFDFEPAPTPSAPFEALSDRSGWDGSGWDRSGSAGPRPGALEALMDDIESEVRRAAALWSRAVPWAARTLAAARSDPAAVLSSAAELAGALHIHAGAATGPATPLLAGRSTEVHVAALVLDFDSVHRLARNLRLTVNDVFVAGLLDGLERYHAKQGSRAPAVRLGLPISARNAASEMHNQVFGAVLRGPLGSLDFEERARLVHEVVGQGRRQPWAALFEEAAQAALRVPGGIRAVATALGSLDVLASNVTGPASPMWLAGVPVRCMTPIGPRSGSAVNATLLSYCGRAAIGFNVDPASVPQPDVLLDCVAAAFDEALSG